MNPEAQAELTRILNKDMNELTENDKSFLRARRTYIPVKLQKGKYAEILGEKPSKQKKVMEQLQEEQQEESDYPPGESDTEETEEEDEEE